MTEYKTTEYKRFGKSWTINECLQLQREFELLKLSIDEISKIHQRTPNAIMLKLDREEFADYNVLYSNYHSFNVDMEIHRKNSYVNEDADEDSDEDEKEENSSEYGDEDCANDEQDDDIEDIDDLKHHVKRIEKQLNALTEMILKQNNKKTLFSMLS